MARKKSRGSKVSRRGKRTMNKRTMNKRTMNKRTMNKRAMNKRTMNKRAMNKRTMNKRTKRTMNKRTKRTMNKRTMNKRTKRTMNKRKRSGRIMRRAGLKNNTINYNVRGGMDGTIYKGQPPISLTEGIILTDDFSDLINDENYSAKASTGVQFYDSEGITTYFISHRFRILPGITFLIKGDQYYLAVDSPIQGQPTVTGYVKVDDTFLKNN